MTANNTISVDRQLAIRRVFQYVQTSNASIKFDYVKAQLEYAAPMTLDDVIQKALFKLIICNKSQIQRLKTHAAESYQLFGYVTAEAEASQSVIEALIVENEWALSLLKNPEYVTAA